MYQPLLASPRFFAFYGLHSGSDPKLSNPLSTLAASDRLDAEDLVDRNYKINEFMLQNIKFYPAEHEIYANKSRHAARDYQSRS